MPRKRSEQEINTNPKRIKYDESCTGNINDTEQSLEKMMQHDLSEDTLNIHLSKETDPISTFDEDPEKKTNELVGDSIIIKDQLESHESRKNKSYKENSDLSCHICDKKFKSSSKLSSHISVIHTGTSPFQCTQCTKGFVHRSILMIHMRTHTGEKPFTCDMCNKSFSQQGSLKSHMRIHTGEKPYICQHCDKSFAQHGHLEIHMRTHTGEKPFQCQECFKSFITAQALTTHTRTHTGIKPFKCEQCGKHLSSSQVLYSHMRLHSGVKPFQCQDCHKSFYSNQALISHSKLHITDKPFECMTCGKGFVYKYALKVHQRTHSSEKSYKCSKCPEVFNRGDRLKQHMHTHIIKVNSAITLDIPQKCDICGLSFTHKNELILHNRTHKVEKPFKCDKCGKQFMSKTALTHHLSKSHNTHTQVSFQNSSLEDDLAGNLHPDLASDISNLDHDSFTSIAAQQALANPDNAIIGPVGASVVETAVAQAVKAANVVDGSNQSEIGSSLPESKVLVSVGSQALKVNNAMKSAWKIDSAIRGAMAN